MTVQSGVDHVTLTIVNGQHPILDVEVVMECGAWVVHRRVHHGVASSIGWTVSHRQTGFALWTVLHYQEALRVCQWAAEHAGIPADKAACLEWQRNTSVVDKTRLMEQLHIVAPRFTQD